jgi:predicted MFS family arabinose efflux permease
MTGRTKARFDGPWIIAACFVTFGIASGFPYYNIAFFYDYMRDDRGWSPQILTFGAPLAVMLTIWAGPLIVPRVSPRRLIVFGTGMIVLAFQWFAHLGTSRFGYYGAWCVWMLGYFTAGPIPHQIILSNWYRRRRGRAMGIAYVGGAVFGAVGNWLDPWLVRVLGYQAALSVLGAVLLIAWPVAIFVLKDRPEDIGQTPDGEPASLLPDSERRAKSYAFLARHPSFWLLLVGSAASIGSIAAVNFLMKFVFEEQGFHDQAARNAIWSTASSMSLMAAIAGRLVVGSLADQWSRKHLMIATYVLLAVAIPLLFLVRPEQPQFAYVFAVGFGFAMGADYMLIPLMAADLFGLPSLARAMAAILPSDTIAQYWCPNLIAALGGAWAGYGSALWVACSLAAVGALAIALLQHPAVNVIQVNAVAIDPVATRG